MEDLANSNNPYLNFLQLRISGKTLTIALFPVTILSFSFKISRLINKLTNGDLYLNYKNLHIDKEKTEAKCSALSFEAVCV